MLVDNEVLVRHVYAERRPRVEFSLTEKGQALIPVLKALQAFGERWMPMSDTSLIKSTCSRLDYLPVLSARFS